MTEAMESLIVSQKKEWAEILTSFETRNRYVVSDLEGNELMYAAEVNTGFLSRNFLQTIRPWTIQVLDLQGQMQLSVQKPFKFYFHRVSVSDDQGRELGVIQRRFSWLRRIYSVQTTDGQELYQLFGPILHPWTFRVLKDGQEVGKITKKWSGLLKESFTDADTFGITYQADLSPEHKDLLLGAVFLIDFVHFEKSSNQ
jgi:uncharacterized protein YxjI